MPRFGEMPDGGFFIEEPSPRDLVRLAKTDGAAFRREYPTTCHLCGETNDTYDDLVKHMQREHDRG